MAQAVSCWLFTVEAWVCVCISPCLICGLQSGTGTDFSLEFFGFSPVDIISPWFFILVYELGMDNRPVGVCSSEAQPHPIDMNMNTVRKGIFYLGCCI
jgi:hypothetical protein